MTVTVGPVRAPDLLHICRHLRERDEAEIYGLMDNPSPEYVARVVMSRPLDWTRLFYLDGEPVAVLGAAPYWSGVWEVFCFGTDKWHRAANAITKFGIRALLPSVYQTGAHRVQCWASAANHDSLPWITGPMMGEIEARAAGYGKDGTDYLLICWTKERMEHMLETYDVHGRRRKS